MISPRRAGKHYCQLRYIGGLSKETGKRQLTAEKTSTAIFRGHWLLLEERLFAMPVDNCYSSSFISVFEAEHEDL